MRKPEQRKAIPVHHTPTSDGPFDGPANEARIPNDAPASTLRRAHAWVDPEKDASTKAAYKFIHHDVGEDGTIGAANVRGCRAIIEVLNGARGGADIPDADRRGVWRHAAAHLRDAGVEPAELKSIERGDPAETVREQRRETRTYAGQVELRQVENGMPQILGYASIFDQETVIDAFFGSWREKVAPGAFAQTLHDDVRGLFNHDPNIVLGRTKNMTLRLSEDSHGLRYEIDPPGTRSAEDVVELLQRGDVDGSSFGFEVVEDSWTEPDTPGGMPLRTIRQVRLFDVSPATFPAYPQTSALARDGFNAVADRSRPPAAAAEASEIEPDAEAEELDPAAASQAVGAAFRTQLAAAEFRSALEQHR